MVFKLAEIAAELNGEVIGDSELIIKGISKIEDAKEGELTFIANPKYQKFLSETKASAVIVSEEITEGSGKSIIRTKNPYYAFLQTVNLFYAFNLISNKNWVTQNFFFNKTQHS